MLQQVAAAPTACPARKAGRAVRFGGRGAAPGSLPAPLPASGQDPVPDAAWSAFAAPSRGWGRAAAIGALLALALHAVVSVTHAHDLLFAAIVGVMGLACAYCAVRCLAKPCRAELLALLGMSAAMVAVHVFWVLALGAGGGHVHGGGGLGGLGSGTAAGGAEAGSAGLAMFGLALAEVGVAALCAAALRPRTR